MIERGSVLFDLDGTLVDTASIEKLRSQRRWKECVGALPRTRCYPGITDVLHELRRQNIGIAVVTASVSFYAEAVCRFHGIIHDVLVCYHDARPKPAPDPFLLAISRLGVDGANSVGVGDARPDAMSLKAAGIKSAGAGWNPCFDRSACWDARLDEPGDVIQFLHSVSGQN